VYVVIVDLLAIGDRSHLNDFTAATCAFLPLFWFYSQSAREWSVASVVVFSLIGAVYHLAPDRTSILGRRMQQTQCDGTLLEGESVQ
jgi:hypothetical protein